MQRTAPSGFRRAGFGVGELLIESGGPTRDFSKHLFNTLTLAAAAGAIVTAGALVLAFVRKERPRSIAGRARPSPRSAMRCRAR